MKEVMNPKWEDADDCEDKMPIHRQKQKLQIRKWKKKERKMTNLHNYYKHNCSSFLGSSSRFMLYTKIVHNGTEAVMKSHLCFFILSDLFHDF